jgi:hypothetical protein
VSAVPQLDQVTVARYTAPPPSEARDRRRQATTERSGTSQLSKEIVMLQFSLMTA